MKALIFPDIQVLYNFLSYLLSQISHLCLLFFKCWLSLISMTEHFRKLWLNCIISKVVYKSLLLLLYFLISYYIVPTNIACITFTK